MFRQLSPRITFTTTVFQYMHLQYSRYKNKTKQNKTKQNKNSALEKPWVRIINRNRDSANAAAARTTADPFYFYCIIYC